MNKLLDTITSAIEDKKGDGIISLDLTKFDGAICKYFVICSADSTAQVAAIAHGIESDTRRKLGERPWRINGNDNNVWIAMDYGDIIVHVFQTEMRDFYRLEELWAEAPATHYGK